MIEQLYAILNDDTTLKSIVDRIEPQGETEYTGNCMLYEFTITGDDRVVMSARLKLTVIHEKLTSALTAVKRTKTLLITKGDMPLISGITHVIANGGGHLYDSARKKHHQIIYFDITGRSDS